MQCSKKNLSGFKRTGERKGGCWGPVFSMCQPRRLPRTLSLSSCLLSEFQNETVTRADPCNPFKSNPAQCYLLPRGTSASVVIKEDFSRETSDVVWQFPRNWYQLLTSFLLYSNNPISKYDLRQSITPTRDAVTRLYEREGINKKEMSQK